MPRPSVLVVEDDDDIRSLVAWSLRADGYDVTEVANGAHAVDVIAGPMMFGEDSERAPDLIVTDVRLPGISGLTLLAGLRAQRCATPIILMTAYEIERVKPIAEALGATVFAKPFDVDELRAAVATALAARRRA